MTNLFIDSLPIVIAINLLVGVIVLFTHVRRSANRVFAILSVAMALWLSCQYFGSIVADESWLTFWVRQACALSVFIPVLFHLLRCAVSRPSETVAWLFLRSRYWFVAAVAAGALCQTHFFLVDAKLSTSAGAIAEPIYGGGFVLFVGYWIVTVAALVWGFFRTVSRAEGVCRMELQIMALGSVFGLVPGVVIVLVIPLLTGSAQSAQFAPIAVVIWHVVIAYGIATRHIMGVGEFLQRAVTYALLVCVLALLYALAFHLAVRVPLGTLDVRRTFAHIAAAAVVAMTLAPANAFLRQRTDRLFGVGQDELSNLLHQGGELARSITTVDELSQRFAELLQDLLSLTHVSVYLRSGSRFVAHSSLGETRATVSFGDTDPIPYALQTERYPLLRDVLRRTENTPLQASAAQALVRVNAEAAVALQSKNGLVGFLLLGRRRSGRIFGKREEDALLLLGDQMGIAIENATLYTRLRDARLYDEVLLDNLVTGVVAADAEERITVCNREAQRILHLPEGGGVIGRPAARLLSDPFWRELHATLASGRSVRDRDVTIKSASGDEQSVRFSTAVFGGEGRVSSGVLLVLQDTSAIRKLEEQIRRSDRLASIGTLAAGMAHEIKNPLVCLKTFVQLVPRRYNDPEFRDTFVPLLGSEVERINAIVSQLLNFARPSKPALAVLSLHAVLDAAGQLASQQIKAKGIVFERRYGAESDRIPGDYHLLGQVFVNLFLNGIEAMERGGILTVATRNVGRPERLWRPGLSEASAWIEVLVSDTGCGIPAENRQRIFDPFFTTKDNGTGLGLSVVHGIVSEHRGVIDVGDAPGRGACFCVLLPLTEGCPPGDAGKDSVR